jgi:hypothetical protein
VAHRKVSIGCLEDVKRSATLSLKRHVKHLLNLSDRRFQEHPSFMFTAFNIIQRREMLLHTSLKVKKANFSSVESQFASVSPEATERVSQRVANGDSAAPKDDEEKQIFQSPETSECHSCVRPRFFRSPS